MPSAVENFVTKSQALVKARDVLDALADALIEIGSGLKSEPEKMVVRHPVEDMPRVRQGMSPEEILAAARARVQARVTLDFLPSAQDVRSAIEDLQRSVRERDDAYERLSEIERKFVDHGDQR